MKPFRKNVALAVDGGGIRGVMVAKALSILEEHLKKDVHEIFSLAAGTSTGSIIAAGTASGLPALKMLELYTQLGEEIFKKGWRTMLWWSGACTRYSSEPLERALKDALGDRIMADLWSRKKKFDLVITFFDLDKRYQAIRFAKPYNKPEKGEKDVDYTAWPIAKAVHASCTVPTYFPPVDGRYIDGGVSSYGNPCYYAAYEIMKQLSVMNGWNLKETTLISIGTGRSKKPQKVEPKKGDVKFISPLGWIDLVLGTFMDSANDQQVHLVDTFFKDLDFRRFNITFNEPIETDAVDNIPELIKYGEKLGEKIISNTTDEAMEIKATIRK